VVDALADEFELAEVALAAVKLVHEASGATEDLEEIPDIAASDKPKHKGDAWDKGAKGKGQKGSWDKDKPGKPGKGGKGKAWDKGDRGDRGPRGPQGDTSRLYVGAGRGDGVRPQDLVGAIAGETHLRGNDIGAIRIFDRFALVEVPTDSVDRVIDAMKATTIRGKKAAVRKDRGDHD
jgi:ATP-dependent RNA helicase DeaD